MDRETDAVVLGRYVRIQQCIESAGQTGIREWRRIEVYFWDGQNDPVLGGTITDGDPNYCRMPLTQGYTGWIGIELDAYVSNGLKLIEVWDVEFYYEPWGEASVEHMKTLYIDELWLTTKNQVPSIKKTSERFC